MFVQYVCVYMCNCVTCVTQFFFLLSLQDLAVFSLTQLLGDTLHELDLTSCVNVTDLSVRAIATYLQKLVVLRLGWCKEVTDWGLLGIVETTKCEPDEETVRTTGKKRKVGNSCHSCCIHGLISTGRQGSQVHPDLRQHGLLQASSYAV